MADISIAGLAALRSRFEQLPARMVKNSIRVGLRQAANMVKDQAKANVNGAPGPASHTGALKKSIRVTAGKGSPTRVIFKVIAGEFTAAQKKKFGADSAFYAMFVEKGHINRSKGNALRGGRASVRAARSASSSNTPPHPFMQPAIESKAQSAIDLMVKLIGDNLAKDAV